MMAKVEIEYAQAGTSIRRRWRVWIGMVVAIILVFAIGLVVGTLVAQRNSHRDLASRLTGDVARLVEVNGRLAANDVDGAKTVVLNEILWRNDVLRGFNQRDEGLLDSSLMTLQMTKRDLKYQHDPRLEHILSYVPNLESVNARQAFEQYILNPKATAPELSVSAWLGKAYALADLRGKVVLLDFWATSCAPCVAGMPKMRALGVEYGDRGFVVLTIHWADVREHVAQFVRDKSLDLPVAIDSGQTIKDYGVQALPTKVLIDRKGRVVWSRDPIDPVEKEKTTEQVEAELRQEVEKALAE